MKLRRRPFRSSERLVLFGYFLGFIALGAILLALPFSWGGADGRHRAAPVDALFTAVSATCVTGLITVDTAQWSRAGQVVILLLIQAGGLGIVTFGMLYLVLPRARIPLRNTKMLRESYLVEPTPRARQLIRSILGVTFTVEGIGAVLLIWAFCRAGVEAPVFAGVFHAVSAFCNAGFSVFSDGLLSYRSDVPVNLIVMTLIIVGGIGFVVIRDLRRKLRDWRRPLGFHSRLMLIAVPVFIVVGAAAYLALDSTGAFSTLPPGRRVMAAFFQSVTTRTAGFNTVDQAALSHTSRWFTLVLMLIGGGSGSTAGGIKVSTAAILIIVLFRGVDQRGDIRVLNRRISSEAVGRAAMFFLKAIALLFVSIMVLGLLERPEQGGFTPAEIIFECVSALGTVGLSQGITPMLSVGGKMLIAATMFAGRVGLFSLVIRTARDRTESLIEYPVGEVLIG